jgi:rhodanese-related sulfurtransferase/predicted small secreted protein
MKKILAIGLSLIVVFAALALVGCNGDTQEATGADVQSDASAMDDKAMSSGGDDATAGKDDMGDMSGVATPAATPGAYTDLTPEQAKQLIDTTPDLVILDVSPKYAEGHLPGAINHYIGDGSLEAAIPTLDQSVPYLVYCHFDSASIPGAQALVDAGFPTVYRLEGNYSAWVDAGYPVEK